MNIRPLTPRRLLAGAWLLVFALYQGAAFYEARHQETRPLARSIGNIFWPADWHMFTYPSTRHTKVEFQGLIGGEWQRLPMERWYPFKWESGYRWERRPFYDNASRQIPFLRAACRKSGAKAARLVRFRWQKTLGSARQTKEGIRSDVLITVNCRDIPAEPFRKVL